MEYSTIVDKAGRTRHIKKNERGQTRFVSKEEYEQNRQVEAPYIKQESNGISIEGGADGAEPPQPKPKTEAKVELPEIKQAPRHKCIFTGEEGPHLFTRFVDGQTVYLNETMYNTKTIGEIASQLRKSNAKEESKI